MYYGLHKTKLLLENYKDDIIFLKWFIDDMFGIWTGTAELIETFKRDLPFKKLQWETTSLKKHGFPWLNNYQLRWQDYLYKNIQESNEPAPVHTCHTSTPKDMIKGIINSLIYRFYKQNLKRKDFVQIICLIVKGRDKTWMKQLIMVAVNRTQQQQQ